MIASFLLPSSYRWSPVQRLITNMTITNPWREPSWLLSCLPKKFILFLWLLFREGEETERERGGREDAQKFDLTREWVSGRVREATRGRRSLSDWRHDNPRLHVLTCAVDFGGTCRRLARNGLCFRGSLCTWNGLREEILPILAATIRPPPSLQLYFQI
jgi:hypothetical protein